jgi:ribosomal protein S18 acetylase RimI-like enzyme
MVEDGKTDPALARTDVRAAEAQSRGRIRLATQADVAGIALSLARAFADDPVMLWVVPSARRHQRLVRMFTLTVELQLRLEQTYTTTDTVGAAVWAPPGCWRLDLEAMGRFSEMIPTIFGSNLSRALDVWGALEAKHPVEPPHWYLGILGTHPDWQSRGIGTALVEPVLARADAQGTPVFLESSKERNVAYYHRLGFQVTGEITVPNGGPTLWPMWREPRANTRPTEATAQRLAR